MVLELVQQVAESIVVAALIFVFGIVVARLCEAGVLRLLHHAQLDARVSGFPVAETTSLLVRYAIYLLAALLTLAQLGFVRQGLIVLSLIVLVYTTVSVLLGLRDAVPNIAAGLWLWRSRPFEKGDTLEVNDITGVVLRKGVLDTVLCTREGDTLYIPSSHMMQSNVLKKK